ncbi:MAG: hypothetical protein ACTHJW_22110 [Streptosporangiaceae bacterium]
MTAARAWLWTMILLTVAAVACAVLLAPPAGAPPMRALSWLLFTGSSAHVASTGWLFTTPAVRAYGKQHLVRCLWVPCGLVVFAAATAAAITPAWFQWLLLPYFGWQLVHYQKQNIGMATLAASAGRVRALVPVERWPLLLAGWSGAVALIVRPALLGLHLGPVGFPSLTLGGWRFSAATGESVTAAQSGPWPIADVVFMVAAAMFAVSAAAGMIALARRSREERPAGVLAAYVTCLLFFLPAFLFDSPYAAVGGLTIAHGMQYLLLVGLIAGCGTARDHGRTAAGSAGLSRMLRLALLANVASIGGAALSGASHLHSAGPAGRLIFGAYLGVVMAHFVIDAGLWRMRDPLARNFLVTHLPYLVQAKPPARSLPALVDAATDRSAADIECRT